MAYSVKQVSELAGIQESTLRAWERRYGVVRPRRARSGYRQYDDADLATVLNMAGLVNKGIQASEAARRVLSSRLGAPGQNPDLVALAARREGAEQSLVDMVLKMGADEAIEAWLMPQLADLGRAWAEGRITVAEEHLVSAALMRTLGRFLSQTDEGLPITAPRVILGLTQGAHHELGLMAFAVLLARRGIKVLYLGADVPHTDWVRMVRSSKVEGVVIGASIGSDTDAAAALVAELASELAGEQWPRPVVAVGGAVADEISAEHALPQKLSLAADEMVARLARHRAR